jgi:hypothetical protein
MSMSHLEPDERMPAPVGLVEALDELGQGLRGQDARGRSIGLPDALIHLSTNLRSVFESPNVPDDNGEVANVVDVVDRHARSLFALADQVDHLAQAIDRLADTQRS